ncbi:MAG: ferrous iron transport protein A [Acidobacteria bacterium]|nr:ferrous iron transport protein A [Acidobacteriota bacterium]
MVPLAFVEPGSVVEVLDFRCGSACTCRLRELGIVRGCRYRVSTGAVNRPFILSNGETRIGIGAGMALKVMVKDVNHGG